MRTINVVKQNDYDEKKYQKVKNNVTSLSSHVLNNLEKNNLWVAQRVKLIE